MTDETPEKKTASSGAKKAPAKRKRNRKNEIDNQRARRALEKAQEAAAATIAAYGGDREEMIRQELAFLATKTAGDPTDADRDIDWAYKNSGNPNLTPRMAPSVGGWQWYGYAQDNPTKFLEICAKREDAKAKQAGLISNQRMEDDKRQKFAVIERIVRQLEMDVKAIALELMDKCPHDLLDACRTRKKAWKAYFEEKPL
jgi:hypothetical protein